MTQLNIDITDRFGVKHGHEGKSKAQGENLAILAANQLNRANVRGTWYYGFSKNCFFSKDYLSANRLALESSRCLRIVHPGLYGCHLRQRLKQK